MGTKRRLTTAVEHVLRENSSVIILEDDCIPTNGFIRWASNRMAVFKDHTGIGMVSGNRFDFQAETCTLSKFPRTWGWGTTRESWRGFQPDKAMDKEELKQIIATNVKNPFARRHWFRRYLEAVQDKHMWDVQWTIHLWGKNKSTLIPPQNLVSNQGGGADATHTFNSSIFLDWPTTPQINPKESKFHLLKDESSRQGVEPLLLRLEVVIGILSKSGASALARRLALSIRTIVSGPID